MKNVILASALLLGSFAMAAEGTAPAAGKLNKKTARAECLKENKDLKGAKLAECVKSKTN